MALPDVVRVQTGTITKIFAPSGGDATLTLVSLASGAAWQSAKLDLGATRGPRTTAEVWNEFQGTPTAGFTVEYYWAPSPNATPGTDNPGGVSGVNGTYTGYSSNLAESLKQLQFIGAQTVTVQVAGTIQKQTLPNFFEPLQRYGSLVVVNKSGAAIHTSDTNCKVIFRTQEDVQEES